MILNARVPGFGSQEDLAACKLSKEDVVRGLKIPGVVDNDHTVGDLN